MSEGGREGEKGIVRVSERASKRDGGSEGRGSSDVKIVVGGRKKHPGR